MALDLKASWPKLILGAIVVITPAVLGYLKVQDETEAQVALANRQADAGYQALVSSVKRLEDVVAAQGVTIQLLARSLASNTSAPYVPMPAAPSFEPLPHNTMAALRQQAELPKAAAPVE